MLGTFSKPPPCNIKFVIKIGDARFHPDYFPNFFQCGYFFGEFFELRKRRVFFSHSFIMSSREDTPISVDADDFSLDNVTDSSLKALLQEETKLKAQLDALTTEIAKLESQINPAPKEDDDEGKWEYSE